MRTISQAWFRRENELADRPLGKIGDEILNGLEFCDFEMRFCFAFKTGCEHLIDFGIWHLLTLSP